MSPTSCHCSTPRRREDGDLAVHSWCLAIAAPGLEAIRAVHGLLAAGLERHLGEATALGADGLEHLARCALVAAAVAAVAVVGHAAPAPAAVASALVGRAALGAAARLVGEALLSEERLLAFREGEGVVAVATGQGLVRVTHEVSIRSKVGPGKSS